MVGVIVRLAAVIGGFCSLAPCSLGRTPAHSHRAADPPAVQASAADARISRQAALLIALKAVSSVLDTHKNVVVASEGEKAGYTIRVRDGRTQAMRVGAVKGRQLCSVRVSADGREVSVRPASAFVEARKPSEQERALTVAAREMARRGALGAKIGIHAVQDARATTVFFTRYPQTFGGHTAVVVPRHSSRTHVIPGA